MRKPKKAFPNIILKAALALVLLFAFSQCSYEPEISDKAVNLNFSTDTIQFDTLFTGRQSITRRLKIYNPGNKAIMLDHIKLQQQSNQFDLILNGQKGANFSDQLLLGNDSLLLLIEAEVDQSDLNNPFVIRDLLEIQNKETSQTVVVEAWGQNAHFLNDSIITGDVNWTADKPYVISNSILIDSASSLTIHEGVKVYSGAESFIYIQGRLSIEGKADSTVLFTNDRLDDPFSSAVGQWGGIVFLEPSTNNSIKFADIKNSIVGINLATYSADGKTDLFVENSKVGNTASSAVLCLNADFEAVNSLFYNTVGGTVAHVGGGTANYLHCTIANYFPTQRDAPAAYFSDFAVDNNENEIIAPLETNLVNSIFYGRNDEEIIFAESAEGNISLAFSNNLFKATQEFLSSNNSFLNQDPLFSNVFEDDFSLTEDSPAINKALTTFVTNDITGNQRDNTPDIGAYEYFIPEDN